MILTLILLIALILGGSYYSYRIAFHSPEDNRNKKPSVEGALYDAYRPRMRELYQTFSGRTFEPVTIQSRDGLTLFGRYYYTADGAPLDICCHGYKSNGYVDFSGGSALCFSMGHNLLLIDQRGQNNSDGSTITFGIQERWDVLAWTRYAVNRFGQDVNITLYGVSMGASTVLMAASLPLPPQVKGIAADCPYAKPEDIILEVGKKMHYPPKLIRPFLHMGAYLFGRFQLGETDAVRSVAKAKVPILIIHGEEDSLVPCIMSETIANANPNLIRRYTFPGAEHAISFLVDEERYCRIIREFAAEILA